MRQIRERLDVVDDRRTTVKAADRRKWRLLPRMAPFPFQGLDETSFFTADICTGAGMKNDIEIVI
jgi:hypothetical protein